MLEGILPNNLADIVSRKINNKILNELRIRVNRPIVVFLGGEPYFLGENGITSNKLDAIVATKTMVEDIVFRASECSIYSVNEQLKRGYLITKGGIRLGIAGNVIMENKEIKTLNNFSSVNIRIPHEVKGCSLSAFSYIMSNEELKNTLIISPPGAGKTTFIRDFIRELSDRNLSYNVLVLDERGEIDTGERALGNFCDILSFISKRQGFENGIRALNPHLIVTDEIGNDEDGEAISYAVNCGVKILATAHASSLEDLEKKDSLKALVKNKVFNRYVVLSNKNGPGTYEGVYNENFSRLASFY